MNATHTRTWVCAVVVDTGLVPWAFRVDCALWFTLNIRIANVIKNTST